MKPTDRKLWAGNLLMWSDLTLGPSFKVKRGQPNLKVLIICLLLVLVVFSVKPTYRKSRAGNLLMWTDLTLVPSLKVKRWFNGFGELSFRWIQICIGSPMHRSSCLGQSVGVISDRVCIPIFSFQKFPTPATLGSMMICCYNRRSRHKSTRGCLYLWYIKLNYKQNVFTNL